MPFLASYQSFADDGTRIDTHRHGLFCALGARLFWYGLESSRGCRLGIWTRRDPFLVTFY